MSSPASSPTGRRAEADLKKALLDPRDLPTRLVQVPTETSAATASSPDPACTSLVAIINAPTAIGTLQYVEQRLSGGTADPSSTNRLTSWTALAVGTAEQEQLRAALAICSTVTIVEPGQSPSTVVVKSVPTPPVCQNPVVFQATYVSGAAAGFEFTQVLSGVDDTVVVVGFVRADQAQIDMITRAALDRATRVLTTTTTRTT